MEIYRSVPKRCGDEVENAQNLAVQQKTMGENRFWESRTHPTGIDKRTLSFGGGKKT